MSDTSSIPRKRCSKCGKEKPATNEYFRHQHDRPDGLRSWCRDCLNKQRREKRANNPKRLERIRMETANQKRCKCCKQIFPATKEHFVASKQGRNGLHPLCKSCLNKQKRESRNNNPERRSRDKQKQHEYMQRPEVRERVRLQSRERRQVPEYKDREKRLAKERLSTEHGKSIKRAAYERRRARLLGAEGSYTAADVELQYRSQKGLCWHCGKELSDEFHIDHLIPLTRGGTNWPNNIVCSCPYCNRSKHNKLPQEWNGRLF